MYAFVSSLGNWKLRGEGPGSRVPRSGTAAAGSSFGDGARLKQGFPKGSMHNSMVYTRV